MPQNRLLLGKVCTEQYPYCVRLGTEYLHVHWPVPGLQSMTSCTTASWGIINPLPRICLPCWEQGGDWRNSSVLSTWQWITSLRGNKSKMFQIWVLLKYTCKPPWLTIAKSTPQLSSSVGAMLRPCPKQCTKSTLAGKTRSLPELTLWCPDSPFPALCASLASEPKTGRSNKNSRFRGRNKITSQNSLSHGSVS